MDYKYILLIPLFYFTITMVSMIKEYVNISTLEANKVDTDSDRKKEGESEVVNPITPPPSDDTTVNSSVESSSVESSVEDTKKEN